MSQFCSGARNLHRQLYHPATLRACCSTPHASPPHYPQRTCRILHTSSHQSESKDKKSLSSLTSQAIHTADEESVAGKDGPASGILHVVADAVLRVARRVHGRDRNVANFERLPVLWRPGDAFAVFAADDGEVGAQLSQL